MCGLSSCGTWAPEHAGAGSLVVARGRSCPVACVILVPQPGIEPTSPALEGGFLTTGPPGKSRNNLFILQFSVPFEKFFLYHMDAYTIFIT